jgi:hypothetical protein
MQQHKDYKLNVAGKWVQQYIFAKVPGSEAVLTCFVSRSSSLYS